jgi:predicted ATPase
MLLQSIELENLLSFKHIKLDLAPLNVLIGANASGKSNLIRALGLVRALPRDLQTEIVNGGGPRAWINQKGIGSARIVLDGAYFFEFQESGQSYEIVQERAAFVQRTRDRLRLKSTGNSEPAKISPVQSALSQVRHPDEPEIGAFAAHLESIRLYREFKTGPGTSARLGISSAALGAYLSEDGGNLALVLNELIVRGERDRLNKHLSCFFPLFTEVLPLTRGGITQLYVREKGVPEAFSAVSLSDGTLRFLCLLAVLLDPDPPHLVCIEEPEIGLHPDAIRMIADLLVEASARMQLVVTTHSPALVDALTAQPESVVVCERDFDGFTQFRRLKSADLDEWLDRYSLGHLWQKGEIGGNRW